MGSNYLRPSNRWVPIKEKGGSVAGDVVIAMPTRFSLFISVKDHRISWKP